MYVLYVCMFVCMHCMYVLYVSLYALYVLYVCTYICGVYVYYAVRVACGPSDQVRQVPRSAGQVPHQTLLHVQHAHHPTDRPR